MEKLLKALEEKGIVKDLQKAANLVYIPKDWSDEKVKSVMDEATGDALIDTFAKDDDLRELFSDFAMECGKRELVKKLDIRPDPNYQKTPDDRLMLLLAGLSSILDN